MGDFMKKTILIVSSIFLILLLMVVGATMLLHKLTGKVEVNKNTLLTISFSQPIPERGNPISFTPQTSFHSILGGLIKAKSDDNIKAILIYGDSVALSLAQKEELRKELKNIIDAGKKVQVYFDTAGIGDYYIIPKGAEVITHNTPGSYISMKGYFISQMFYKRLLEEKLHIKVNVIHIGDYKGAGEPFSRNSMSKYLKEELTQFVEDLWTNLIDEIPEARGIDKKVFEEKLFNGEYFAIDSKKALEEKLIDKVEYKLNLEENYNSVLDISDYITPDNPFSSSSFSKAPIALIVAEGSIGMGEENPSPFNSASSIAADTMCRLIREAADDSSVKAIVFRINSPGGSALASELIYQELIRASAKKPVVATIGGMGASGGFYIAAGCDYIIADKSSLVGSIGVISIFPDLTGFFDNIGVGIDSIEKGKHSDFITAYKPLSTENEELLRNSMLDIYSLFKQRVAKSRNMTLEQVEKLAQGKIYSGRRGKELGLVDEIGGLKVALIKAKALAGLKTTSYRVIDKKESIFDMFKKGNKISAKALGMKTFFPFPKVNTPLCLSLGLELSEGRLK